MGEASAASADHPAERWRDPAREQHGRPPRLDADRNPSVVGHVRWSATAVSARSPGPRRPGCTCPGGQRGPGGRRPGRASPGSRAPAGRPVERPSFRTVRGVTPARASEVRDRSLTSAGTATAPQESRRSRSGRCHHGEGRTSLHPLGKVGLLRSPVLRCTPAACRSTSNPRASWAGFASLAGVASRADDQRRDWPSDDVKVMPGGYGWDCDRTPSNPASPPPAPNVPGHLDQDRTRSPHVD